MSIQHIEGLENRGEKGLLAKTDTGAGASAIASTIDLSVDFDAEELACRAKIGDLVFFREQGLDFNPSFCRVFWAQHRDVIDI